MILIDSCCTQKENSKNFSGNEMMKMQLYSVVDTAFVDTLLSKTIKAHYELFKCEPQYFDFYIKQNGVIHGIRSSVTYCGDWDYEFFSKYNAFCFYKGKMLFVTKKRALRHFKEEDEFVYVNFITEFTDVSVCDFDSVGNLLNYGSGIMEVR